MVHTAIILAGGTARRLGGVSKPDYNVAGRRLLDIVLDELDMHNVPAERVVVVGPPTLSVPTGVRRVLEDPPYGGPLAGIGAGVDCLDLADSDLVAFGTCDAPLASRMYSQLVEAVNNDPTSDGAAPVTADAEHWIQYMHGVYRFGVLKNLVTERDRSFRSAFRHLNVATVSDCSNWCIDVDTPDDVYRLAEMLA